VRGNIRAGGEKIYHLPGDPAYDRVHPEETFASPEEAEAAGYRRAGR
jgi:micrococcal nuclease